MTGGAPDEFGLIAELFAPLAAGFPGALGLADDAAFIAAEPGFDTVATMDSMVAGVHFLPDDPPDLIARKLIRVNLSDLAAKGAEPRFLMLSAAFPRDVGQDWLRAFGAGLAEDVRTFGIHLIGGDTVSTPGPLTLTLTALGRVKAGRGLKRSGAKAGDTVWVSGSIGDGALGLKAIRGLLTGISAAYGEFLSGRYRLPHPRVSLGPRLLDLAHGAMDVSDGLVQDLGHLCRASGLAARIEAARIPLSPAAAAALELDQSLLASVLTGGDDYELLFTASAEAAETLADLSSQLGVALTGIGRVEPGDTGKVTVIGADGREIPVVQGGWRHFGGGSQSGE
ncbi:Thiamine-monophosphate kinase [Paramagnetospirillum magnetotacticum MS-1]|uniref:Thiamine-monophosphate kinase n=1 Tax=Paramagnetospirillum magnetotacticum MS-1 TaxID=272627 RepID=A0A0C2YVQ7_PARME|nr:Thiamine-monophosphate kinase [Paramagnetospirillum magnetotacticum MS-1]